MRLLGASVSALEQSPSLTWSQAQLAAGSSIPHASSGRPSSHGEIVESSQFQTKPVLAHIETLLQSLFGGQVNFGRYKKNNRLLSNKKERHRIFGWSGEGEEGGGVS